MLLCPLKEERLKVRLLLPGAAVVQYLRPEGTGCFDESLVNPRRPSSIVCNSITTPGYGSAGCEAISLDLKKQAINHGPHWKALYLWHPCIVCCVCIRYSEHSKVFCCDCSSHPVTCSCALQIMLVTEPPTLSKAAAKSVPHINCAWKMHDPMRVEVWLSPDRKSYKSALRVFDFSTTFDFNGTHEEDLALYSPGSWQ